MVKKVEDVNGTTIAAVGKEIDQVGQQPKNLPQLTTENMNSEFKKKGLFKVMSGNEWIEQAKTMEIPRSLIDHLWFMFELCILFAEPGAGKTAFAVQQAIRIAKELALPVLLLDFELTAKQWEQRYSNEYTNHYVFPDNLYRAEVDPDNVDYEEQGFNSIQDYMNASIEEAIKQTGARVIVIDNITYLSDETEKAKFALPLMKHLKALKTKYNLSILALAHTPKRDMSKPLNRNDLSGSKMLMNFCDSCFAIGESTIGSSFRYIKQLKVRYEKFTYTIENVAVYELQKTDNFLFMAFTHCSHEREHLKEKATIDKQEVINTVLDLNKKGLSQREIALQIGMSVGAVNKYINNNKYL